MSWWLLIVVVFCAWCVLGAVVLFLCDAVEFYRSTPGGWWAVICSGLQSVLSLFNMIRDCAWSISDMPGAVFPLNWLFSTGFVAVCLALMIILWPIVLMMHADGSLSEDTSI